MHFLSRNIKIVCFNDLLPYTYIYAYGRTYGHIIEEELGDTSFGYDCIFYSHDLNKTFGEATSEEKNSVSHRKRAIVELRKKTL